MSTHWIVMPGFRMVWINPYMANVMYICINRGRHCWGLYLWDAFSNRFQTILGRDLLIIGMLNRQDLLTIDFSTKINVNFNVDGSLIKAR